MGLRYLEKDYLIQKNFSKINNIIVLGGAEHINATKNTNKLNFHDGSERLIASVKLAIKNPDAVIYFLGGNGGNLAKYEIDEAYIAKLFFYEIGFDLNRVVFIKDTNNTIQNFYSYKKLNLQNNHSILITSASHMNRSLLIANKLDIKAVPYAVDFKSINYENIINSFLNFSITRNLSFFDLYFREIIGIIIFKLFY